MKRAILITAIGVFCLSAFAQEEAAPAGAEDTFVSKKGVKIRPEAEEIGLGFNFVPFAIGLNNVIRDSTINTVNSAFVNGDQTLYGKYLVDRNTAYRARVRITDVRHVLRNNVVEDGQLDPEVMVTDRQITKQKGITLGAGFEKRRGKGRVQGVYGAEAVFSTFRSSVEYQYGNEMSTDNIDPETTTDFSTGNTNNVTDRVLSSDFGRMYAFGINGFIGVEYFFAPKISIGGDFTWGLSYSSVGESETVNEKFTTEVETITTTNGSRKSIGVDNYGGAIAFMFYF